MFFVKFIITPNLNTMGFSWPLFLFWIAYLRLPKVNSSGFANTHLPGWVRRWTFPLNIGLNMLHSDSCMSCLDPLLGYPTGEFQALQLIVLVVFGLTTCLLYVGPLFGNLVWNYSIYNIYITYIYVCVDLLTLKNQSQVSRRKHKTSRTAWLILI